MADIPIQSQELVQPARSESTPVLPKEKPNLKIIVILLVAILLIAIGTGLGMQIGKKQITTNEIISNKKTPTITVSEPTAIPVVDEIANWKTYTDKDVRFSYPSTFTAEPIMPQGSGFTQEFKDSSGKYTFSFVVRGNYNQETGKPFTLIDDFIGMPYQVKILTVGGQSARQPLPRAGSEHENSVSFFSQDKQNIYTFDLQTGDNPMTISPSDIAVGQQLFDQILSTFKFVD